MKNWKLLTVLAAATALASTQANATSLSVFGISNWGSLSTSSNFPVNGSSPSFGGQQGWGGGVEADFSLVPLLNLSVGADYVQRGFNFGTAGVTTSFMANYIEIPVMVKLNLGPFMVGAGPYYATAVGSPSGSVSTGGNATFSGFGDLGLNSQDYGIIGTVGFALPLGPVGVFVQGRYLWGLDNISNSAVPGTSAYWRNVQLLAGLSFG